MQDKDIKYLQKEFDRLEDTVKEGFNKVDGNIGRLDAQLQLVLQGYVTRQDLSNKLDNKADRWVQQVVGGGVGLVLITVVGAALALIITL